MPHLKPFLWLLYNFCFYIMIILMVVKIYFLK